MANILHLRRISDEDLKILNGYPTIKIPGKKIDLSKEIGRIRYIVGFNEKFYVTNFEVFDKLNNDNDVQDI